MSLQSIWSALEESSEILFGNYAYPAADKAAQELSLPPGYYAWATVIWLFDVEPFTITQFMRYLPYGLAQVNAERLTSAVQQRYLASDGQGVYRATELGRTSALRLIQAGNEVMATLTPMPSTRGRKFASSCLAAGVEALAGCCAHRLTKASTPNYRDIYASVY